MPGKIKIAIIGVGNCASSLIQGLEYYKKSNGKDSDCIGLMHYEIGHYKPRDIQVVAAFDIDERKVGKDISEAIFALPNCTKTFFKEVPHKGVTVHMGQILDGVAEHMDEYDPAYTFVVSKHPESDKEKIVRILKESSSEILVNYLPVGSEKATRFYMECALEAGVAVVNNIPVFIASDPLWEKRFRDKNIPIVGDDIKSQLGATITHRVLANLFKNRGVKLLRTYQLNVGGNTDFLNMLDRNRLASKKTSKTEAVQSVLAKRLDSHNIHVGPSDYVPWQRDNKICFIRMEAEIFGGVPINLELRLSVEDSPNSAGIVIDGIRCCKLALDRGEGGAIYPASAYFYKHPPKQFSDDKAHELVEAYIKNS